MKSKLVFGASALIFLIMAVSCTKEGLGGDATLNVRPTHHGKSVKSIAGYPDTVFVKFNARELPGTAAADFDTYFTGIAGSDQINCTGLKQGEYYLFVVGFDTTIKQRVKGGVAYRISRSDRKKAAEVEVPVTED
jgi:hypothetical protein